MPDESSPKRQDIIRELDNLKRKTALMQACHGQLAENLSWLENLSSILITIISFLAIIATTAEARTLLWSVSESDLKSLAALCSLAVFFATLVKFETRWGAKAAAHTASLKALTRFLRQLDITLKTLDDKDNAELETLAAQLVTEYSDICEVSPDIPSKQFLKLKQQHLQKIALSRALDKEPFTNIRKLRRQIARASKSSEN